MIRCALLAALLFAGQSATGQVTATVPAATAQERLPTIPLTLTTATGRHRYTVEVAATPRQQQLGLMFRQKMAPRDGMLFPFDPPRPASFWMQNTPLPLDLIFIDAGSKVRNIAANATPYSRDFIASDGPVVAVLELNAGEAARIGLRPGNRVAYKLAR